MHVNNGVFILIAGANASGKTTVIKPKYVEGRVKRYLDPDRLLPIAESDILSTEALECYKKNLPARFAVTCMEDWLDSERIRSEGIATESNLVTKRDFRNFKIAKEAGMRTELYFVGVSLETALQRKIIRADKGEQDKISDYVITTRHADGLVNIPKHIDSGNVDVIMIYDNSRCRGEEQLLLHVEDRETVFRHPTPPEWFNLSASGAWGR